MTTHKPNFLGPYNPEGWEKVAEELLKGDPKPKPITPSAIKNPKDYILLLASTYQPVDLLIAKTRSHLGENWEQCQEALPTEGHVMPTIRQFVDFLNLLQTDNIYDGSGSKLSHQERTDIFKDITEKRDPYRAEWLDAQFSQQNNQWFITYHKLQLNGTFSKFTEPLEACFMTDRIIGGISLEDWLKNPTSQGLPQPNIQEGSLAYWRPRSGFVSQFANSDKDKVFLDCYMLPQNSVPTLGVRAARIKT